jgi:hypothetical protein
MARTAGALSQTTLNVSSIYARGAATEKPSRVLAGGKRKSDKCEDEGRRRKVTRFSGGNGEEAKVETTTPPGSPKGPTTPIRSVQPTIAPTPARDILKAGYDPENNGDEEDAPAFVVKPPTPPRMKPRPLIPSSSDSAVPTTPGKRCLSPDQLEHRSAKRAELPSDNPTTPIRSTAQEDVSMLSVVRAAVAPTRTTVASPHRALSSISRLNTPHRATAELKSTTPGMARMIPTVPIPFSFNTPRAKAPATTSESTQLQFDPKAAAVVTSSQEAMGEAEVPKEVKPLPKRAVMPPPSMIPVRSAKTSLPPLSTSTAGAGSSKPKPSLGLANRRPVRRTTSAQGPSKTLAVFNENTDPADAPVRRKPSYPSSLGSGPLAQPRPRLISGPIQVPRSFTAPLGSSTSDSMDVDERPTMRSVSDPVPRAGPRPSLASSTSRREGVTADTNDKLAGLNDALAKLKVRRDASNANSRPGPSAILKPKVPTILAEVPDHIAANNANTNVSIPSSSRMSSVHRPRSSIVGADVSMMEDGDRSIAALISSSTGSTALKGVIAFVDVRTEDGACSGDLWSEMLRSLGAKVSLLCLACMGQTDDQVNVRLTSAVTHIIFKSGLPTTLAWYRRQDQEEKPYIVGVGWLLKSKKAGEKLDEAEFTVDIGVEDIFQKVSLPAECERELMV